MCMGRAGGRKCRWKEEEQQGKKEEEEEEEEESLGQVGWRGCLSRSSKCRGRDTLHIKKHASTHISLAFIHTHHRDGPLCGGGALVSGCC